MTSDPRKTETGQEQKAFGCASCQTTLGMTRARQHELACCGQRLTRTEVISKSDPTPFGP